MQSQTPTIYNNLPINGWELVLSKLPNTVFFTQEYSGPSITFPEVEVAVPQGVLKYSSERIEFSSFDITCIVDTELRHYIEVYNWMKEIRDNNFDLSSTGMLALRDGSSGYAMTFEFYGIVPVSISPLSLSTTAGSNQPVTVTYSFAFTHMEIRK